MDGKAFLPVATAIAAHLALVPPASDDLEPEIQHLRRATRQAVPRSGFAGGMDRDHAATLASAVAAGRNTGAAVIADAVAALSVALPWHYHYAPRPGEADLAGRIAFAELIGPQAPLIAPACRVGFTLMAASTFYPLHNHPAIELYLVISGHAQWTTPGIDRIVPPGGFVLHHADEPHAMQTFAEPLLAVYGWRGDIDSPAVYL